MVDSARELAKIAPLLTGLALPDDYRLMHLRELTRHFLTIRTEDNNDKR